MFDRRLALIPAGLGLLLGIIGVAADAAWLGLLAGLLAGLTGVLVVIPTPAAPAAAPAPAPAPAMAPEPPVAPVAPAPVSAPEPDPVYPAVGAGESIDPDNSLLDATGLFNEDYFRVAVETRVSAARRHLRPVAVVLFDVMEGETGSLHAVDPAPVVASIRATLREADTACRLDDGRYAFVLEDTPEDGAIWTVERLRRNLSEEGTSQIRWAGIACYPAHAFSAEEALAKVEAAFIAAREWPQDRIEVATSD